MYGSSEMYIYTLLMAGNGSSWTYVVLLKIAFSATWWIDWIWMIYISPKTAQIDIQYILEVPNKHIDTIIFPT